MLEVVFVSFFYSHTYFMRSYCYPRGLLLATILLTVERAALLLLILVVILVQLNLEVPYRDPPRGCLCVSLCVIFLFRTRRMLFVRLFLRACILLFAYFVVAYVILFLILILRSRLRFVLFIVYVIYLLFY